MEDLNQKASQFAQFKAAERTFLAWVRTGVALVGLGFVVARFNLFLKVLKSAHRSHPTDPFSLSRWIGLALVGAGICVVLFAGHLLKRDLASIRSLHFDIRKPVAEYLLVIAVGLIGVLLLAYLFLTS
jgi:putative membrane protein